jgi:Holliday junction resolvase
MTNYAYRRGNDYERRVMHALQTDGYVVWQSRGSKSPVDLICLKRGQVLLVQVKGGRVTSISHDQWNALLAVAQRIGALAVIADRDGRKIRYRRIAGAHLPRSQNWPSVLWEPDSLGA